MVVNQAAPLTTALAGGEAWIYNIATGEFIGNAAGVGSDGQPYRIPSTNFSSPVNLGKYLTDTVFMARAE